MAEHPIQGLMNVTMEKIHQMVDSNTIIGKPIITEDGTTILPVSKVSFGFASGGTDFDGKNAANKDLFGGGSGAGVNIQPVAFLVVKDGCVRTIQLSDNADTINRALTMLPELVDKVAALIKKDERRKSLLLLRSSKGGGLAPDTPSRLRSPDHQRKKPSHFPMGFSVDFSRSLHFRHGFAHLAGVSGADPGRTAGSFSSE